jgi:hypothetical protein
VTLAKGIDALIAQWWASVSVTRTNPRSQVDQSPSE